VIEEVGDQEAWFGETHRDYVHKIREEKLKTAKERLDQICDEYLKGCPLYIKHTAIGDPAEEILKFINKEKVDIVVMATRGSRGRFRFGSVTEQVVKHSTVPVVTVPIERRKNP
jgi:nucleotide-binding universal stress UspA family protein